MASSPSATTRRRRPAPAIGPGSGRSFPAQVVALASWPFLEHLLNSLVGFVDTALAGRLGVAETNALAVTGYVGWLVGMLHMAVGVGAGAVVARAIGGQHRTLASAALGQAMLLALGWGAAVGLGVFLAAPFIGRLFGLEGEALDLAVLFIRLTMPIAPVRAVLFVGAAAMRAAGDTRTPFLVMLGVNLINIAASVLLVFGPAPLGGHGVSGIAAGTALAWGSGGLVIGGLLLRGVGPLKLFPHRMRPHPHTMRRIVRVGAPNVAESSSMWLGNALIAMIVGHFLLEKAALGAHIIAVRVESLSFLPGMALATAAATLAGQYLGAGDGPGARRAIGLAWCYAAVGMTAMGAVFMAVPVFLARILAPEEAALYGLAAPLIRLAGGIQFFFATYIVLAHALRGAGDTRAAMAITLFGTFAVRLPAAYVLGVSLGWGLYGVWLALCGELVVRGSLFAARFLGGRWQAVEV